MWAGGASKHTSRGSNWKKTRESVFHDKGNSCVICGLTRIESSIIYNCDLHIDHITPFHSFKTVDEANNLNNLRPLCIMCHAKDGKKVRHGFYKKLELTDLERKLNHPKVKYTLDDCRAIKKEYKTNGVSWSNIADIEIMYSISRQVIRNISNGKHWSNVYI